MSTKVHTKQELLDLIHKNGKAIEQFGVLRLGIFGSFARDEATNESDVDFFIDLSPDFKTLKNVVALANFLETITGRKAEIVTPQSLNEFIGKYILAEVEYVALAA